MKMCGGVQYNREGGKKRTGQKMQFGEHAFNLTNSFIHNHNVNDISLQGRGATSAHKTGKQKAEPKMPITGKKAGEEDFVRF